LGDTPYTIISNQLLRRGLCKAYVAGNAGQFDGAIIQARDFPEEPSGFGEDPLVLWELLKSVDGWTCVWTSAQCAPLLGRLIETEIGAEVRYLDDVCCAMTHPAPTFKNPAVRLLTIADLTMLEAAAPELRASCYANTRDLLENGIVACAVIDGEVVATALAAARSDRFAEVGVFTAEPYRGRGFSTAASALVCAQAQADGQQPIWSAGAHNAASLRVAQKLGFVEIGRHRYVILEGRGPDRSDE
jgi:GNAT superfamily N-acetyltransferase